MERLGLAVIAISRYKELGFITFIIALTILFTRKSLLTVLTTVIVSKAVLVALTNAALTGFTITAIAKPIVIAF